MYSVNEKQCLRSKMELQNFDVAALFHRQPAAEHLANKTTPEPKKPHHFLLSDDKNKSYSILVTVKQVLDKI